MSGFKTFENTDQVLLSETEYYGQSELLEEQNEHVLSGARQLIANEMVLWAEKNIGAESWEAKKGKVTIHLETGGDLHINFEGNGIVCVLDGSEVSEPSHIFGADFNRSSSKLESVDIDLVSQKLALIEYIQENGKKS